MANSIFTRLADLLIEKKVINTEEILIKIPMVLFPHGIYTYMTSKTENIKIKEKYLYTCNGFTRFMIIDENNRHFCVNNSFWYWKWNSIEDYFFIKENEFYSIRYYGFRIPLCGIFPNIFCSSGNVKELNTFQFQGNSGFPSIMSKVKCLLQDT